VKAAADCKEQLKKELEELNKRKIQAMAEIEAQEEMEDEEEERLRGSGIDVTMDGVEDDSDVQPKGLEEEDAGFVEDDKESEVEDAQMLMKAKAKAPAKKSSVSSSFGVRVVLTHYQQRAKKPGKGETRMAVEVATEAIKDGKKRKAVPLENTR